MFKTIIEKGNSVAENKLKTSIDSNLSDKMLIQMYKNWIQYVKETVPKDQLLIFNARDGVDKVAKFLGRKTPSWKLPHMNGEMTQNQYHDAILYIAYISYSRISKIGYMSLFYLKRRNTRSDFNARRQLIMIIATLLYGIFGIGMYGVITKSIIYTLFSFALLLMVRVSSIFVFIRLVQKYQALPDPADLNFLDLSKCRGLD